MNNAHRTTRTAFIGALFVCSQAVAVAVAVAADGVNKTTPDFVAGQEIPLSLMKPVTGKTAPVPPVRATDASEDKKRTSVESTDVVAKRAPTVPQFVAGGEINLVRGKDVRAAKAPAVDIKVPIQREETYGTVSFYSEYYDHAVRWADGPVSIFDSTGFSQWSTVLERLQPFMGKVTLKMARDEASADIVIDAVDNMPSPHEQSCGITQNYIGKDNSSITKARTKMRRIPLCIGDGKELHLYMHELGHALGFARHSKDDDLMAAYVDKEKVIRIPTLSRFLTGMYGLEVGAAFPSKEFYTRVEAPTAWLVADGSIQPETDVHHDPKAVVIVESSPKKVKSVPAEVSRTKEEVTVEYRPLASTVGSALRQIQIIGPTGVETVWVSEPVIPAQRAITTVRRK